MEMSGRHEKKTPPAAMRTTASGGAVTPPSGAVDAWRGRRRQRAQLDETMSQGVGGEAALAEAVVAWKLSCLCQGCPASRWWAPCRLATAGEALDPGDRAGAPTRDAERAVAGPAPQKVPQPEETVVGRERRLAVVGNGRGQDPGAHVAHRRVLLEAAHRAALRRNGSAGGAGARGERAQDGEHHSGTTAGPRTVQRGSEFNRILLLPSTTPRIDACGVTDRLAPALSWTPSKSSTGASRGHRRESKPPRCRRCLRTHSIETHENGISYLQPP